MQRRGFFQFFSAVTKSSLSGYGDKKYAINLESLGDACSNEGFIQTAPLWFFGRKIATPL